MIKNNSTIFNKYGDALEDALAQAGKKPVDLSNKTGIAISTISKYISGAMNPPKKGRQVKFEKFCGARIFERPDGKWTVQMNEDIAKSRSLGKKAEDLLNGETAQGQSRDTLLERIQYAEDVIRKSRLELQRRFQGEDRSEKD